MFVGIFVIALTGNWVIEQYDFVSIYPKATYISFGIGWGMVLCSYIMSRLSTYKEIPNQKDNRDFINKWERRGVSYWGIVIALAVLVGAAFYSWPLAFRLFFIYIFIGIAYIGFLYIMMGDRMEEPDDWDTTGKTKKLLDLIDYRRHPFTISLIMYSLVIISFLLSKQLGIPIHMEVSGNPKYITSLPVIAFLTSGLMVVSIYVYIINNGDIFGIRKATQNENKMMLIRFLEICCCGLTLFIWLVEVVEALILYF